MILRVRLTLVFALAMALVLIGTGATLFLYLRADLRDDFQEDLERLSEAYAQAATGKSPNSTVKLRSLPPSPVPEEIEAPEVFLLDANGRVLEQLASNPMPLIPAPILTRVQAGQSASFDIASPELRPLWLVALSPQPLPLERRAVLQPITRTNRVSQIIMVSANDIGLVRVLDRVRNGIVLWGVIGSIVAFTVGFLLSGYVTRPLLQIADTAQAISDGALSKRIPQDAGHDEIARLKQQLNAMLERLEALMETQRRFTADAAHDLRTPLAVIRGELEIALRKPRSAESYRDTLERTLDEVKRFAALAEDMLLLSRLEAGVASPLQRINLAQALEPTLTSYSVAAQQHSVHFSAHIPPKLELNGDATALARAISNLLANALNHGLRAKPNLVSASMGLAPEPNNEIGLEVLRIKESVQLRVFDSGQGIPQTQREYLFERFSKGESSSGAGLGLAIVAGVARQHKGRIFYETRSGGGSVFVLEVPLSSS